MLAAFALESALSVSAPLLLTYDPNAVCTNVPVELSHRVTADEELVNSAISEFLSSKRWRRYIKYAASRYEIPGKFDADEGRQEALMIAHKLIQEGYDIASSDFRAMFKTAMWHRLIDLNAHFRTKGRNYRKEKSISHKKSNATTIVNRRPDNPAMLVEFKDDVQRLQEMLPDTAKKLLDLLLQPSDQLRNAYEAYLQKKSLKRRKRIPTRVFARALGVKYKEASNAMKSLRRTAVEVFGDKCNRFLKSGMKVA